MRRFPAFAITAFITIDSAASDASVSSKVFSKLVLAGTIKANDMIDTRRDCISAPRGD